MILYSIVSPYDIFCTGDLPKTSFRAVNGGLIEYSEQNGIKTARRLISTDPFMYLDQRYSMRQISAGDNSHTACRKRRKEKMRK